MMAPDSTQGDSLNPARILVAFVTVPGQDRTSHEWMASLNGCTISKRMAACAQCQSLLSLSRRPAQNLPPVTNTSRTATVTLRRDSSRFERHGAIT
jgi:hypothetical protein